MIILAKLNALESLQYRKAIMSRADSIKTLYQELKAGILSLNFLLVKLKQKNHGSIQLTDKSVIYWHVSNEYKKNMGFYVNGFSRMAMEVIPMQET